MNLLLVAIASAVGAAIGAGAVSLVNHGLAQRQHLSDEERDLLHTIDRLLQEFLVEVYDVEIRVKTFQLATRDEDPETPNADVIAPSLSSVHAEVEQLRRRASTLGTTAGHYPAIRTAALEVADRVNTLLYARLSNLRRARADNSDSAQIVDAFSAQGPGLYELLGGPLEALALAQSWTRARLYERKTEFSRVKYPALHSTMMERINLSVN
jgi:hypothetical protein